MTSAARTTAEKLGLVIDLDTCVGCHACATSCKEWNAGGYSGAADRPAALRHAIRTASGSTACTPTRSGEGAASRTVHFPRSCLHCETPACVTVCPTGASYKRAEDGIVLVNADNCIGCKLCSWACPYGAREYRLRRRRDEEMHALRRPHLQRELRAGGSRQPACVRACPTGARHFGDLGDPDSAVSQLVDGARRLRPAAGDGLQAGQQIPAAARRAATRPRSRRRMPPSARRQARGSLDRRFFAWADQALRAERSPCIPPIPSSSSPLPRAPAMACCLARPRCGARIWCRAIRCSASSASALALALVTAGLLSSTFHLGRPERAWRAFSQWRSSWLSREGVAALATYHSGRRARLGLGVRRIVPGQLAVGAVLSVPCALVTVWCTGMIYASLPTIRAWNQPLVAPLYVVLALATGGVLLNSASGRCSACAALGGDRNRAGPGGWRDPEAALLDAIDTATQNLHRASRHRARPLRHGAAARPAAHPAELRDARDGLPGGAAARRKLRRLSVGAFVPVADHWRDFCLLADLPNPIQIAIAALSALSASAGVLTERWLFFAEAEHVVMVFYRGGSAYAHRCASMSGATASSGISIVQTRPVGS